MHRLVCLVTFCTAMLHLLGEVRAVGNEPFLEAWDSVYEAELVQQSESIDDYQDYAANAETMIAPTLEIAAEGFVSTIAARAWSFNTELVAFHPDYSDIEFTEDGSSEYFVSPRFTLGWESKKGYGFRGRLWGYEAEGIRPVYGTNSLFFPGGFSTLRGFDFRGASPQPNATLIRTDPYTLRNGMLDLEFYKRFEAGRTQFALGAGIKSAALELERPASFQDTALGLGLGVNTDLRHALYQSEQSEIALVSSGRVGFLRGKWTRETSTPDLDINPTLIPSNNATPELVPVDWPFVSSITETDVDMVISEASLGIEWRRDLNWTVFTLRAQYEAQLWNTDITDDLVFTGGAIKAGFSW